MRRGRDGQFGRTSESPFRRAMPRVTRFVRGSIILDRVHGINHKGRVGHEKEILSPAFYHQDILSVALGDWLIYPPLALRLCLVVRNFLLYVIHEKKFPHIFKRWVIIQILFFKNYVLKFIMYLWYWVVWVALWSPPEPPLILWEVGNWKLIMWPTYMHIILDP